MARITRLLLAFLLVAVFAGSTVGSAAARTATSPAPAAPLASAVCCGDEEDPPTEPVLLSAATVRLQPGELACTDPFMIGSGVRLFGQIFLLRAADRKAKLTVWDLSGNRVFFQRVMGNFDITVRLPRGTYFSCIRNPAASGTAMDVNAVAQPF